MSQLDNKQIIDELMEIRKSLFMWNMDLSGVDRLLRNFDYDTYYLRQYPAATNSEVNQTKTQPRRANVSDVINDI